MVLMVMVILLGTALTLLRYARARARDAVRLSDMRQITFALNMYFDRYNQFPPLSPDACCDDWDQGPCNGDQTFIGALVTSGIISQVPVDPLGGSGTGCYGYGYYRYSAGANGCDSARGPFFVLGIRDMGASDNPHPESRGWSCPGVPGRNWQDEFEWVTGGFEKE